MPTRINRESLVAQVVDILRRDLHRYVRFKWLPGERALCERFHVSRTTMRAVLAQLQRQGLIRAVPCKGYRVQAKVHRSPQRPSRAIGCLLGTAFNVSEMQGRLLLRNVEHILNKAGYLMQRGLRLPQDVSLVCRDCNEVLDSFIPPVTCYVVDREAYARRCARTLIQMATAGSLRSQPRLLMARFTPGGTVASPCHVTHAPRHLA